LVAPCSVAALAQPLARVVGGFAFDHLEEELHEPGAGLGRGAFGWVGHAWPPVSFALGVELQSTFQRGDGGIGL